jgi:hypothetical protein
MSFLDTIRASNKYLNDGFASESISKKWEKEITGASGAEGLTGSFARHL